jgi:MYXO-CTERM domain-containing protein
MKAKSALIASIATVGIANVANAQDYTAPAGPVNAIHQFDLVITDSGIIQDLDVTTLWASHGWAGDIIARIEHVDTGTIATLFHKIGDATGTSYGDSSDLVGAYRFDDASANSIWTAAAGTGGPIPAGTYFASGPLTGAQTFLNVFNGENINGTWRLHIEDTFPAGTPGTVTSFTLHATVPAPGALALLGLAGVTAGRRRKRS